MNDFLLHILSITVLTWITYAYIVFKGGWVIDDIAGIANYDGKLPKGAYYGDYLRWFRWKVAGQNPMHHHCFNVILKNACCVMLYFFLRTLVSPYLAFTTSLLFVVTPIGTQTVAWVSGVGYLLGLFAALIALQIPTLAIPTTWGLPILLYALFIFLAVIGNFTMLATFMITLWLGHYSYVLLGALVALAMAAQIVYKTIILRSDVFKSQNMGASTRLHWRKGIVAVKCFLYYTCLAIFPARMGLYHKWGFHYEKALEQEDTRFWLGLLFLAGIAALFYYGDWVVRFGIVWYVSFLFIFLNWITIHQWVSERYVYIASIGIWIIMAHFLEPYPIVYAFILGLYLMRTWQQLPAYQNEITFYQSNIWNFPRSEVALANLAAVYLKVGLSGSAVDMWNVAIRVNPDYDVPYYNLYSVMRAQRQWALARQHLLGAIKSPVCHFKERWQKELIGFDKEVAIRTNLSNLIAQNKFKEANQFLVGVLCEQDKTPVYLEDIQQTTFKNYISKEIELCGKSLLNSQGQIAEAGSSSLPPVTPPK